MNQATRDVVKQEAELGIDIPNDLLLLERLMVAPNHGLGFLTNEMVQAKLRNMAEAAHSLG